MSHRFLSAWALRLSSLVVAASVATSIPVIGADRHATRGSGAASSSTSMAGYRTPQTIPYQLVAQAVAKIRGEADKGDHRFCLFDCSDRCFYRNVASKDELGDMMKDYNKKNGKNIDTKQATATVLIVETGDGGSWGYHTADVIYTDKGPFVFDPDIKSVSAVFQGDILTPLSVWLQKKWNFKRPITMLAPPGVIFPSDIPGAPGEYSSSNEKYAFWKKYSGKSPSDPFFDEARKLEVTSKRVRSCGTMSKKTVRSSKENFKRIKEVLQ